MRRTWSAPYGASTASRARSARCARRWWRLSSPARTRPPTPPPRKPAPLPAPAGRSPTAGGAPIPAPVATAISSSFGVDVSPVRVHSDANAVTANSAFGARAFAFGSDVFLGRGERATDVPLMAHEVAHVVQQQGGPRVQLFTNNGTEAHEREAQRASAAVVAGVPFTVRERTRPRVQRLGISDALDYFADKANNIPGFRMFTIVLGVNPINMSSVDRSAANIMRAIVEFLPGGHLITQALDQYGVFDKVGNWVDQQIKTLGMTGAMFKKAISDFLDSLHWRDIFHLGDVWERAKRIFTDPISRLIDFGKSLVAGIIKFIKDAILMPLARLAERTRGWPLLIAVLGRNPITGEAVPRTANTLIPGFLTLIGQQQVWENMQRAHAVPRAWNWFQTALSGLLSFVSQIPTLFISALRSLEITDIVVLPRAFVKVATVFGNFIGNFISWAGRTVWNLLEIVFDVVSPGAWGYIKRTGGALRSILRNPLPFVRNLVHAAKLGFQNFASNFGAHLRAGMIDWLTGSLPGVYIPKAFSLQEIVKFVMSVLGISWANVRAKLVKLIPEPAVKAMETGFDIVVTLVRDGPAAAWEKIKEQLGNLKDMVIGGITDFVIDAVVKKAIPKLLAMFIPGAGFVSAILSIYDTVMVFVQKISRIIQVVRGFIDSIVSIASGAIGAAASRVESVLAGLLSLAISFFAGFIGLGRVADKIMGVLARVRTPVDKGLDALVAWIVGSAKRLFQRVFGGGPARTNDTRTDAQKQADLDRGLAEAESVRARPDITEADIRAALPGIKAKYKLVSLDLVVDSQNETQEGLHFVGEVNPKKQTPKSFIKSVGGLIKDLSITRPSFRRSTIEAVNPNNLDLLKKQLDMCHVVSSSDMAKHYEDTLKGKKWAAAAALLTPKIAVDTPVTDKTILKAVRALHRNFFNDVDNLFLGGASVNRALGERLDPRHPDMQNANKLKAHIKKMCAKYALGSFSPTL